MVDTASTTVIAYRTLARGLGTGAFIIKETQHTRTMAESGHVVTSYLYVASFFPPQQMSTRHTFPPSLYRVKRLRLSRSMGAGDIHTYIHTHLDHEVAAADDLDAPAREVTAAVAGVVHAVSFSAGGRGERVGHEALGRPLGHVEISDR